MKQIILGFLFCCTSFFFSQVFAKEVLQDKSFDKILQQGTLRVCSQAGFIPFEMKDNKGNWKGFDIDLIQAFANFYSLKIQMLDTNLDGLIPALTTGKCDLIASGLTITEKRKQAVLFSQPVYTVVIEGALLDTPENRLKYKKFNDIDTLETRVASHTGSAASLYLKDFLKYATSLQFDSQSTEIDAVLQKKAQVFVEDNVFIAQVSKEKNLKFYTIASQQVGDLAMAARKKDKQIIEKFNKFLLRIQNNGEYDLIRKAYFD